VKPGRNQSPNNLSLDFSRSSKSVLPDALFGIKVGSPYLPGGDYMTLGSQDWGMLGMVAFLALVICTQAPYASLFWNRTHKKLALYGALLFAAGFIVRAPLGWLSAGLLVAIVGGFVLCAGLLACRPRALAKSMAAPWKRHIRAGRLMVIPPSSQLPLGERHAPRPVLSLSKAESRLRAS
jgi:hypothetical protein